MKRFIFIFVCLLSFSDAFTQSNLEKKELKNHLKEWQEKKETFIETKSGLNNEKTLLLIDGIISYIKISLLIVDERESLEKDYDELKKQYLDLIDSQKKSVQINTELIEKYEELRQDYNQLVDKYNKDIKK